MATIFLLMLSITSPEVFSGDEKPAPPPGNKVGAERADFLQTVGLLTASQVYQAYLNIGFVADGKANGNLEEKDAQEILGSVLNLLNASDRQLEKLTKLELPRADRESLEHLRRLGALVREEGEELRMFWKTGDKDHSAKYEKLRQDAWAGISKVLGLDKVEK